MPVESDTLSMVAKVELGMNSRNVMSVDVEDYFHAEAFSGTVERAQWDSYPSRVQKNTERLLELLAMAEVHATFFVLGWVAERHPRLLCEILSQGHELACHSYWHRPIYQLTPEEFRQDTRKAKAVIEQASGQAIQGYRAPTFSIIKESLWAMEILVEEGFTYDSSIFPIQHDRYGMPAAPRYPVRLMTAAGPLLEFPMTTFRIWGTRNLPVGGGGYLRLLPNWYTQLGLRLAQEEGLPFISYIHPWEVDPDQPRLTGNISTRLRHYTNLSKTYDRLHNLLRRYHFTGFRDSGLAALASTSDPRSWN
jgi:polysaccharide deacetylase family protein (PEP-CTERM system associated)